MRTDLSSPQIRVHGITEADVAGAPTWPYVAMKLEQLLDGVVLAAHSMFDKQAIDAANELHGRHPFHVRWINTLHFLPRAWPGDFHKQPCGLDRVSQVWGIRFQHHDALADAMMCGLILSRACQSHNLTPDEWVQRCNLPV